MKDYIKTKCMSLAEEAKIIRRLERLRLKKGRRAKEIGKPEASEYHYSVFFGLRDHRLGVVRGEARHSNIAYGFLRGHAYHEIERSAKSHPYWAKIEAMIEKYGEGNKTDLMNRYKAWKTQAIVYLENQA